jgi:predicted nucleotidyltransferase
MRTDKKRFEAIIKTFPKLDSILMQLCDARIPFSIGGSVALYVQGHDRLPNDVDIMFTDEAFAMANQLLGLKPEHIERPYNSMNKSTPVDDGTVEFLNRYTAKADNRLYYTPPLETIPVTYGGIKVDVVVAEKIAVFKLISRRSHHSDVDDFKQLFQHPNFDMDIFWQIVDSLKARKVVARLLES